MLQKLFCFLFLTFLLSEIHGHTYHLGRCPAVEPMNDFNMNRMLGIWYVIEKTSTASTCITYNFTKLEEPYHYNLEQVSQNFILGLTPFNHESSYTGKLFTPDPSVPGKMKVKFSLNVVGKASFTVFMTDYDNYAGIFTCQGLGIGHRQSASILSRTPTLDKVHLNKLRTSLSSYNIDPFDLSIISQKGCRKNENGPEGVNIHIDDKIEDVTEFINKSTSDLSTDVEENIPEVFQVGSTDNGEVVNSTSDLNTEVQENIPEVFQDGSTENGEIVNVNPRLNLNEETEWLP